MEAKLQEEINKLPLTLKAHLVEPEVKAVAEIFFKAGIREVVEWLPWEKTAYQTKEGSPIIQIQISEAEWEAQLKEWGVE